MKRNYIKLFSAMLLGLAVTFTACDNDDDDDKKDNFNTSYTEVDGVVTIKDLGEGTGTITWSADKTWVLDGLVFVNSGQTLTIEPGTLVKGKPGQEEDASALIVARGGKIYAEGTAAKPIVFTAEADNYEGTSLTNDKRGLWGGLIVLGAAKLNSTPGETAIEGIPTTEPRGLYGGTNDTDNSGIIKYVSIRHGGTDIGEGNEINGLTLGGVGSGTTIEYVEVLANKDDGVEFFGGTVNTRFVLVSNCGDDSYDYDEGFRGKGQFWVAIQDPAAANRGGEHDGGTNPEDGEPYAKPEIRNATFIGKGTANALGEDDLIIFRDNAGGFYYNSIFVGFPKGINIEILGDGDNYSQCSYKQMVDGNLKIENNLFYGIADNSAAKLLYVKKESKSTISDATVATANSWVATYWTSANNVNDVDPGVSAASPVPTGNVSGAAQSTDSWFMNVSYKGAFEPGVANHWAKGWTRTFAN